MDTFGRRLRRLREQAGLSQSQLARMVPISQSSLSRYEADRQTVARDLAERLDELVHADGALLGLFRRIDTAETAGSVRVLDAAAVAAFEHTPDLAALIADRTAQFRRLDDFVGGRELYPSVRRSFEAASEACRDDTTALPDLSELGQIAGWVASDAGRTTDAAHLYLTAAKAGEAAGRLDLGASALSSLAYQLANSSAVPDRAEAVLLASAVVNRADGVGRALLLERLAWAHARIGDVAATLRVLDEVDEVFDDAREPAPPWAYWLDQDEINVMRGRCMVELNRPSLVIKLLSEALSRYDPTRVRERGLYTTYLAEALVKEGDVTEALRLLDDMPQAESARLQARLDALA
ncbi:helix-turn-helix domain-containing protein [Saccharomonospora cyanea]|uniref:Putative transcriptional regulator n=1 Tax=Saccharomonospora cyanea NA-134 TaxID=882082 RepID=H5XMH9_9PSEU|nr:helix-turn-helix domain-containing protein [Saccharomonospora cyanea]EHR59928.1 putative transcriptional regulator [Saccharomonospora cyanea NA-134]